jgi:hypothetical protein
VWLVRRSTTHQSRIIVIGWGHSAERPNAFVIIPKSRFLLGAILPHNMQYADFFLKSHFCCAIVSLSEFLKVRH